jgi:NADH-quinone oxidoreductase subunit L
MANRQNIDLMGGFRKSLPFTSAALIVGALALAAFPLTSGWFSKDEILDFAAYRGGFYVIFTIGGYIGALLTAFYAFRIGFRVVFGPPCEVAQDLEKGVHVHLEPQNPATGEPEDTDVGFPGEKHTVAEDAWPMKIAMTILGFGALFAGFIQIPGVDDVVHKFLHGSFLDSKLYEQGPSTSATYHGLVIGGLISVLGIAIAYYAYLRRPGTTAALTKRFPRLHDFLERKWYFDEAIDVLVVRPALAIGRGANAIFERYVVQGLVVGVTDLVRGAGVAVRGAQSGYLRSYALFLVTGFAGLGLYFLLQSS